MPFYNKKYYLNYIQNFYKNLKDEFIFLLYYINKIILRGYVSYWLFDIYIFLIQLKLFMFHNNIVKSKLIYL